MTNCYCTKWKEEGGGPQGSGNRAGRSKRGTVGCRSHSAVEPGGVARGGGVLGGGSTPDFKGEQKKKKKRRWNQETKKMDPAYGEKAIRVGKPTRHLKMQNVLSNASVQTEYSSAEASARTRVEEKKGRKKKLAKGSFARGCTSGERLTDAPFYYLTRTVLREGKILC